MKTAVINIRTKPDVKKMAQEVAEELGLSLGTIINAFLKQFIRTKTIFFTLNDSTPTPFLLKQLQESEADRRAGRVHSFKSKKQALEFIDELIK